MSVLVIGSLGNMGKRYCAILKQLGIEFTGMDVRQAVWSDRIDRAICEARKIIVAVPTVRHVHVIEDIAETRKRNSMPSAHVLCEKPLATNPAGFERLRRAEQAGVRVFCVNQYAHHPQYETFSRTTGRTHYNYFKHGDDGLVWDCFQLFVLAKGTVSLNDQSPVWTCRVNGTLLNLAGMDLAYVKMVEDFIDDMRRVWDLDTAEIGTKKVQKWIADEAADIAESQNQN